MKPVPIRSKGNEFFNSAYSMPPEEYVEAALAGNVVQRSSRGTAGWTTRWEGMIAAYDHAWGGVPSGLKFIWLDHKWHELYVEDACA